MGLHSTAPPAALPRCVHTGYTGTSAAALTTVAPSACWTRPRSCPGHAPHGDECMGPCGKGVRNVDCAGYYRAAAADAATASRSCLHAAPLRGSMHDCQSARSLGWTLLQTSRQSTMSAPHCGAFNFCGRNSSQPSLQRSQCAATHRLAYPGRRPALNDARAAVDEQDADLEWPDAALRAEQDRRSMQIARQQG